MNTPVLLLADEPTGNLDSTTSVEVMEIFTALNRQGLTVLVVTHEPDIATFAQRRIMFRDGLVVANERRALFPPPLGEI